MVTGATVIETPSLSVAAALLVMAQFKLFRIDSCDSSHSQTCHSIHPAPTALPFTPPWTTCQVVCLVTKCLIPTSIISYNSLIFRMMVKLLLSKKDEHLIKKIFASSHCWEALDVRVYWGGGRLFYYQSFSTLALAPVQCTTDARLADCELVLYENMFVFQLWQECFLCSHLHSVYISSTKIMNQLKIGCYFMKFYSEPFIASKWLHCFQNNFSNKKCSM